MHCKDGQISGAAGGSVTMQAYAKRCRWRLYEAGILLLAADSKLRTDHKSCTRRIVTVHREDGQISGAAAGSVTLQDAPMRMALQPQETTLAVALGDGGILKFSVARDKDDVPVLQQLQGILSYAQHYSFNVAAVAMRDGAALWSQCCTGSGCALQRNRPCVEQGM